MVRQTTAPGGRWGLTNEQQMDEVSGSRRPVALYSRAGSVTQAGETVGLNAGAPLPQGWYAINTVDWGCMEHHPAAHMYGSHHSGCRLVNAVDDFGRESTVAGGVAWGGSRRATQPTLR